MDDCGGHYLPDHIDLAECWGVNGVDNILEMPGHNLGSLPADEPNGIRPGVDSQDIVEQRRAI